MKKLLLSATAFVALTAAANAADLPSRHAPAPVITAAPVFTWTGFYAGIQAGYAWGEDETGPLFDAIPGFGTAGTGYDVDGFVGGGHAGFSYQIGLLVLGVEGDLEAAAVDGDRRWNNEVLPGVSAAARSEINVQGSIRGRVGFALDRALVYGTAGFAFANIENTYNTSNGVSTITETFDDTKWGWTIGTGVEYAITNNLTARVEYRYTQLEDYRNASTLIAVGRVAEQEPDFHTVRAGVSYRFSSY
jgi:outer membrane immunogenic protein